MSQKTYLGDGLYAELRGDVLILKANDDERPTDTVYLEPEVMASLVRWYEFLMRKASGPE